MPVTINGSTGISGVDGSAGTPALIGSDADTGIFVAAGQVSASINGTAGNVPLVSGTAQNSTSGTSIDFTGIPSWVKRVTVMLNEVSTNGSSAMQIQIGAGSITSSGYTGYATRIGAAPNNVYTAMSAGFLFSDNQSATATRSGLFVLTNISSNNWVLSGSCGSSTTTGDTCLVNGKVSLSGTLDRVRITTVNGTDTFDAGSINIMYE